jgi:hypothetical protein
MLTLGVHRWTGADIERDIAAQRAMSYGQPECQCAAWTPPAEERRGCVDSSGGRHHGGMTVVVDVSGADAPVRRPWLRVAALFAAVALLASAGVAWWLLMPRNRVSVPDLRDKTASEARAIVLAAGLQLQEEQREENGKPEGLVIEQDPAPSSAARPQSTVKIVVATAPKPKVLADVSGRWDSSINFRYDVMSLGGDFFFRRLPEGSSPERVDERGSGSVSEGVVTAQWSGDDAKRPTSGRILHQDDKGVAQVIRWNDGLIWFRPKEEGAELVRHYHLDQYDRAVVLEAIQKGMENDRKGSAR